MNTTAAEPDAQHFTSLPCAGPGPVGRARLRATVDDFKVTETLSFEPSGQGPHLFLRLEKRSANTEWVAAQLARQFGIKARDVGYAGLKDRHALTVQWFSVPLKETEAFDASQLTVEGVRVLDVTRNLRKLKIGALAGNRFELRLRDFEGDTARLEQQLAQLREHGFPNYFGPQRFGRNEANIAQAQRALSKGGSVDRKQRSRVYSTARSVIFNHLLAALIRQRHYAKPSGRQVFILDGSHSRFVEDAGIAEIAQRLKEGDIHLAVPLWGSWQSGDAQGPSAWEIENLDEWRDLAGALESQRLDFSRRAARVMPDDLHWDWQNGDLILAFGLPAGAYATSLLREILEVEETEY